MLLRSMLLIAVFLCFGINAQAKVSFEGSCPSERAVLSCPVDVLPTATPIRIPLENTCGVKAIPSSSLTVSRSDVQVVSQFLQADDRMVLGLCDEGIDRPPRGCSV